MGFVLETEALLDTVVDCQHQQQIIVTTNGCFDVLHVGHLRYLQAAKELGDVLVVLINSDASVTALKGPTRPILPEFERAELVAGLECVDFVAIFHKDTPIELLERIRPNIHVKGNEYSAESLPEATILEGMGTQLAFIPMVPGSSTTNIIEKIIQSQQPHSSSRT